MFQTTLAPETCFKDIFSLESASFMTVNLLDFEIKTEKFWELPQKKINISEDEAIIKIDNLISKSIEQQLIADVPVVSMMSGGIDFTLITTKAKAFNENISAFTISYPFSEDEVRNASLVAKNIKISHSVKKISTDEILNNLKESIQHFEEPYSGLELLINAAEYAKNHDFKVVLSGNGADELFAGYSHSLKLNKWVFRKNFNFLHRFIFTKDSFL